LARFRAPPQVLRPKGVGGKKGSGRVAIRCPCGSHLHRRKDFVRGNETPRGGKLLLVTSVFGVFKPHNREKKNQKKKIQDIF